jgi:hypothetical protein
MSMTSGISTECFILLPNKNQISEAEQSRAFAREFQADLWCRIMHRLEIKLP